MKKLVAGHFVGEFGWLLMRWQGIIRHIAKQYDHVTIGCEKPYKFLFEDFADEFVYYTGRVKQRNMWQVNGTVYPLNREGECIVPSRSICLDDIINKGKGVYHQDFIKYGSYDIRNHYDILIHARSTNNYQTGYRNWPEGNWNKIVEAYPDMLIASVGSPEGADYIDGTDDLRGIDLDRLADVMASSEVLLSPSSGAVHFVALCGMKHIVWSKEDDRGIYNNRERNTTLWNPFNAEVIFIPNWQPSPNDVLMELDKCLSL